MIKIWNSIKALFCAVFALIFIGAVVLGVYLGLDWLWDFALKYGDLGIGFMLCFSVVLVAFGVIELIKFFYREISR